MGQVVCWLMGTAVSEAVFALQAYVVVGKQVNRLLQNCIILVLHLKSPFKVNEEESSGW